MSAQEHGLVNILVSVDTASILSGGGLLYMMDDNPTSTSAEGSTELHTNCSAGDTLNWRITSINQRDTVEITGFETSNGVVFGFDGAPKKEGETWTGFAQNKGQETYQIRILVNGSTEYSWDPFVIAS